MIRKEEEIRDQAILDAAEEIALAVRTAPKTKGRDIMSILVVSGEHKEMVAAKMDEINEQSGGKRATFSRDAKNVMASSAILLIGVKTPVTGLNCGWCGSPTCGEKPAAVPCVFGVVDLGVGAGVASARMSDKFIDNRMMFSIGYAALKLGWFASDVTMVLGFPMSASGKNPCFDRG